MQRRRALLGAAAPAAAATATLAAAALAQTANPEVRWRMSSAFPRNLAVPFGTGERLCQRVAALTGNKFQIRFFPAGEVVPGLQVLDAVQAGAATRTAAPPYGSARAPGPSTGGTRIGGGEDRARSATPRARAALKPKARTPTTTPSFGTTEIADRKGKRPCRAARSRWC